MSQADRKHVEPNPAEQAVLSRIRKLRLKGCTLRGGSNTQAHHEAICPQENCGGSTEEVGSG